MAHVGVMIEAQEGLTWARWRRIAADAERLGFASLRTSDHCGSVMGVQGRPSLSAWPALALAAEWTERIELGPMVSPMTFYVPAVLGRMARDIDAMSRGRLLLGVGAGWNEAEHREFGIPLPGWRERFDNLEAGIERIEQTCGERRIPLLIGGRGERRTLPLAARRAAEWNCAGVDVDGFRASSASLDRCCRDIGRDPAEIRRSLMSGCVIGRDQAELRERARGIAEIVPRFGDMSPDDIIAALRQRWFVGTPEEIVERMQQFTEAGVDLFMLQHFLLDDGDALELLAETVMAAVA
jgi:alkanesulfonate monooxygenase SsuD/methylene tetrahydromethanopterin reductase-like flavin-dependent oxidoreductase (luciferase family)